MLIYSLFSYPWIIYNEGVLLKHLLKFSTVYWTNILSNSKLLGSYKSVQETKLSIFNSFPDN